jgi:hypothetical protein
MAGQASFIGGMIAEASLLHAADNAGVAQTALVGKKRVRGRERPAAINRFLFCGCGRAQPNQHCQAESAGDSHTPAPRHRPILEIIEIMAGAK